MEMYLWILETLSLKEHSTFLEIGSSFTVFESIQLISGSGRSTFLA